MVQQTFLKVDYWSQKGSFMRHILLPYNYLEKEYYQDKKANINNCFLKHVFGLAYSANQTTKKRLPIRAISFSVDNEKRHEYTHG